MFDHVTLRVPDLADAERRFQAMLDPLAIDQSLSSRSFAAWEDFILTLPDDEHPGSERAHVAFVAPSRAAVDEFWEAGTGAGLRDDGPPGLRPHYSPGYYAAFLKDAADNSFEAVHHETPRRGGNVDHVALRVADLDASTAFYETIAAACGLERNDADPDRVGFIRPESRGRLSLVAGPPSRDVHIAFPGDSEAVRRFHADAIAAGYRSNGEPGERPRYHAGYYAAYVLDPDGNNIEVVDHHRP
jgi:catechol 2,3-dioxygenase-like lactoylglutathione lyase family enzyme